MSQASELIAQQFINGGVVPAELVGQNAASKKYVDDQLAIRDTNIANVAGAAGAAQADIDAHEASTTAHPAQNITYSGLVAGAANVKQGLDNLHTRVNNIIADGDSSAEVVDARGSFPVLGDRLNATAAQLADIAPIKDNVQQLENEVSEHSDKILVLESQYNLKLRDIKQQYGAVFSIGENGGVYQTRDGSRIFCPMILTDRITKMTFELLDGDTWLFLGGLEATYTFVSITGGLTGNVQNATSISAVGSIGTVSTLYQPTVGDVISVERQAGKYVFLKKNSDDSFSVFMTIVDTDFPTANFNTHNNHNLGLVAHNGNTGSNGIIKNVVLNYDKSTSQSGSSSSGSFWRGKKYNAFGDSFTRFNNYQIKIKNQLGIGTLNSYGVDGSTIADVNLNNPDAFSVRYATMDPTADLVTILGGTNDFSYNVPLGTINDTTRNTFYGALRVMLEGITNMMPSARIIMFTPMQRDMIKANYPGETAGLGPNTAGFTLLQYVDAIIQMCGIYSIPVYDLYRKSGVNKLNIETYTKQPGRDDRLHPNEAGFVLLARQMAKFIDQC
jgi:lysophospholipase L1-like esterase